jgi:hypothetical protein
MPRYLIVGAILFYPAVGFAFLDFIGDQAKKAVEVAAYTDAVVDLSGEIATDDDVKVGAQDIRRRSEAMRATSSNLRYVSRSTRSVLNGPDWSSRRLETNIRSTTDYIRRVKRLVARAALLGTDGVTAFNTTETNVALNEIQKNQQTLILQNEDAKLREIERESEDRKQWAEFSDRQRRIRKTEAGHGKL